MRKFCFIRKETEEFMRDYSVLISVIISYTPWLVLFTEHNTGVRLEEKNNNNKAKNHQDWYDYVSLFLWEFLRLNGTLLVLLVCGLHWTVWPRDSTWIITTQNKSKDHTFIYIDPYYLNSYRAAYVFSVNLLPAAVWQCEILFALRHIFSWLTELLMLHSACQASLKRSRTWLFIACISYLTETVKFCLDNWLKGFYPKINRD